MFEGVKVAFRGAGAGSFASAWHDGLIVAGRRGISKGEVARQERSWRVLGVMASGWKICVDAPRWIAYISGRQASEEQEQWISV